MKTMKNPEVKAFMAKLSIISIVMILSMNLLFFLTMRDMKLNLIKSQQSFIGAAYSSGGVKDESLISEIFKEPSAENIETGKEMLKSYGYSEDMDTSYSWIVMSSLPKNEALITIAASIFCLIFIWASYKNLDKTYAIIRNTSSIAEDIVEGRFSSKMKENMEGDLGTLALQINKMSRILSETMEKLQKDRDFLKDTMSDISHQLKTPMASLTILNDLMLEDADMKKEVRQNFLANCSIQLKRMDWLVKSMLKLARLEAGAIKFKKDSIDMTSLIESAEKALSPMLSSKGQHLRYEGSGTFLGDREWSMEAIINILKNASEHSYENSFIDVKSSSTPVCCRVIIRDYGSGISSEDLPHIFERFYKGRTSTKGDSIGIGLAMSKTIIENMGGYIEVKTKKDEGTSFTITFLNSIV